MNKKYSIITAMTLVAILLVNPLTISAASDMFNGNETDREVMTEHHHRNHMTDEDYTDYENHMTDEGHMHGRNRRGNNRMTDNEYGHHHSMRGSNRHGGCHGEGRMGNHRYSSRK